MTALGSHLQILALAVRGRRSETEWGILLRDLTAALEMDAAWWPTTYRYPVQGKGGVGVTIIQPITESFFAVDVWPDHGGAYLVLCSCRPFEVEQVLTTVRLAGLEPVSSDLRGTLTLVGDPA